jgi:hypothetical protein
MKTLIFTPPDETGIMTAHTVPYAGNHDTRLGCAKACEGRRHSGALSFRAALGGNGFVCARASRAAVYFIGKFKRLFRPPSRSHAPAGGHTSLAAMAAAPARSEAGRDNARPGHAAWDGVG